MISMKNLKMLLAIMFALLLGATVSYAATAGNKLDPGKGNIVKKTFDWTAEKTFRLVRYVPAAGTQNAATLDQYSIVVWDTVSDDGVTVTTTTTSGSNAVAGIIVQNALTPPALGLSAQDDAGKRNWTWLQTYGYSKTIAENGGLLGVGDTFGTSTTAGKSNVFVLGTTTVGVRGDAGFAYDTATGDGSTTSEVFVKCE